MNWPTRVEFYHMVCSTFACAQPFVAVHVDTYFATILGTSYIAALGVASISITTWFWVVTSPIWVFRAQIGRAAANQRVVRKHIIKGLSLTGGASLVIGLPLFALTETALSYAGGNEDTIPLGIDYHQVMAVFLFVIAIYQLSVLVLLSLNRFTAALLIASLVFLLNISGNFLAVYLYDAGLWGLGISAIVSQALGAGISLLIAYFGGSAAESKPDHSEEDEGQLAWRIVYALVGSAAVTVVYYFLGSVASKLGTLEAAAHAKVNTLFIGAAYFTAGLVNVTETKGYDKTREYRTYRTKNLKVAMLIGAIFVIVFAVLISPAFWFASSDLKAVLLPIVLIASGLQFMTTLTWTHNALLRSRLEFGKTALLEVFSMLVFLGLLFAIRTVSSVLTVWSIFAIYFVARLAASWWATEPR